MEIKDYKAPSAEVIEVNVQNVLCQSTGDGGVNRQGNESMGEIDYGNGGFA